MIDKIKINVVTYKVTKNINEPEKVILKLLDSIEHRFIDNSGSIPLVASEIANFNLSQESLKFPDSEGNYTILQKFIEN